MIKLKKILSENVNVREDLFQIADLMDKISKRINEKQFYNKDDKRMVRVGWNFLQKSYKKLASKIDSIQKGSVTEAKGSQGKIHNTMIKLTSLLNEAAGDPVFVKIKGVDKPVKFQVLVAASDETYVFTPMDKDQREVLEGLNPEMILKTIKDHAEKKSKLNFKIHYGYQTIHNGYGIKLEVGSLIQKFR